jgi:hypothetical protein
MSFYTEFHIDIVYVICMYVCMYVVSMYICMYVCMYVCKEIVRERETRLRAGRPGFGFRQGGDVYYLRRRVRDGCGAHLSGGSYLRLGRLDVGLAARLRLVPGLGVRGAVSPLPASSWRVV